MKTIVPIRQFLIIAVIATIVACQSPHDNTTGSEYMPDMGHSIAYEANYSSYYYNNTWSSKEDYEKFAQPRTPVKGTIPYAGGSSTYPYGDTEEERTKAISELTDNPYPITDSGLSQGKELYNIFCAICHGEKGDGGGYLVRDDGGVYPVQPANFLLDEHLNASNGRYYHAIMYGKNLMGAYKDKINEEERWQVIHYIRSLQAKEKKVTYSQMENSFNTSYGTPAGEIAMSTNHQGSHHMSSHDDEGEHQGSHHHDNHDNHDTMHDGHHDHHHDSHGHDNHGEH